MKRTTLFAIISCFMLSGPVSAAPEDMSVTAWEGTCHRTTTTNHFDLAPGESVEFDLDLTGCSAQQLGNLLYFGFKTTKNSSRMLTPRDKIELTLVDGNDQPLRSMDGSIFTEIANPTTCTLKAKNMNARKTIKVRLRSSVLIPQ